METVEIVVKMPKFVYDMTKAQKKVIDADVEIVGKAIGDGILLPEGYKRLIDVNDLCIAIAARMFNIEATNSIPIKDLQDVIDNALTIIEVDKDGK